MTQEALNAINAEHIALFAALGLELAVTLVVVVAVVVNRQELAKLTGKVDGLSIAVTMRRARRKADSDVQD